ncbi:hypothetical protein P171DRAFT_14046 [Karstenula rhodostoma CBS 690.94]|uniref:Uncharacterized protein n=1 Tax=Karstenula rhodostoma CBS 690.94 TaxID=1392251 RepID=A0A9P4PX37_9PLEO|nr:hypothetical protein P171DRAFT_14046 [Karstenula rhodostoma CBS 690.94]
MSCNSAKATWLDGSTAYELPRAGELLTTGEPAPLASCLLPLACVLPWTVPARALPSPYLCLLAPSIPRTRPSQHRRGLVCAPFAAPDFTTSAVANQRACFRELPHGSLHAHRQVHAADCCIARYKLTAQRSVHRRQHLPLRLHECLLACLLAPHRIASHRNAGLGRGTVRPYLSELSPEPPALAPARRPPPPAHTAHTAHTAQSVLLLAASSFPAWRLVPFHLFSCSAPAIRHPTAANSSFSRIVVLPLCRSRSRRLR